MTRIIPARLLRAGSAAGAAVVLVLMVALTACGGSPAPSSSSAAAASSAPGAQGSPASAHAVDKTRTVSPYGAAPDGTLPKVCPASLSYLGSLLGITNPVGKLGTDPRVCVYAAQADMDSSSQNFAGAHADTMELTGAFGVNERLHVRIPSGAPFDQAYVWLEHGGVDTVAHLTGTKRTVWFAVWKPHASKHTLIELGRHGLQNIMYWWPKAQSPAPAATPASGSDGAQAPDLAACKVLPSSIFTDLLGGAAVANFNGSTARLCTLNAANGATAVIADRPSKGDTSTLTSVGNNVWEQDTHTYMTFVNGHEIGVESLGGVDLINSQTVIAALAALN